MLTNFTRAKLATHSITVAITATVLVANHFCSDPHAAQWLSAHWAIKDLGESIGTLLAFYGIYASPLPAPAKED